MQLHLGCGKRFFPGWFHVDIADFEHIDLRTSVNDLSKIASDSVTIIYASHVLEYFDQHEVMHVLTEWKRVLKIGGTLRVSVPDFDALIKVYHLTGGNINYLLGPLYGRMAIDENSSEFIYHKVVYNFDKLSEILTSAGFSGAIRYNWQDRETADYDDHSQAYFPHMDKSNGIHVSLNLECTK